MSSQVQVNSHIVTRTKPLITLTVEELGLIKVFIRIIYTSDFVH